MPGQVGEAGACQTQNPGLKPRVPNGSLVFVRWPWGPAGLEGGKGRRADTAEREEWGRVLLGLPEVQTRDHTHE